MAEIERLRAELRKVTAERDAALARQSRYLTDEQRRAIVTLIRRGLTDREVARQVGVSPTTVGKLRRSLSTGGK